MEIDVIIAEKERLAQKQRAELASTEADLRALYRTRALMRGESDSEAAAMMSKGRASIPDLVEAMLRTAGELHADEITRRLKELGHDVKKQTVTASLVRYTSKGKRFRRTGANKFALLESDER